MNYKYRRIGRKFRDLSMLLVTIRLGGFRSIPVDMLPIREFSVPLITVCPVTSFSANDARLSI